MIRLLTSLLLRFHSDSFGHAPRHALFKSCQILLASIVLYVGATHQIRPPSIAPLNLPRVEPWPSRTLSSPVAVLPARRPAAMILNRASLIRMSV